MSGVKLVQRSAGRWSLLVGLACVALLATSLVPACAGAPEAGGASVTRSANAGLGEAQACRLVRHCGPHGCRRQRLCAPACPDGYSCHPLYGAYGPYGGVGYWGGYGFSGWGDR
jgi:hypothetical protein